MSSLLTRERILGAADRPIKTVNVPEWGGDVLIATMDGRTRAAYEEATEGPYELLRAAVVSLGVVDESGAPIFSQADLAALNGKSAIVLNRLFKEIVAHNKLRKEDREASEKNSPPASGESSCTDSPDISATPSASYSTASAATS